MIYDYLNLPATAVFFKIAYRHFVGTSDSLHFICLASNKSIAGIARFS